jgi:hypothetical protein
VPRRARHLIPDGVPRRVELIAACAVTILLAHLLLAQLTLLLALVFALVSKATRWRLGWLAWPALAGLAWTIAVGPGDAIAGFTAGPSAILWHLGGGRLGGGTAQPLAGFAGAQHWLPRQFPLALVGGAAEAALLGWLDWVHTDEWAVPPSRPGLIAGARRVIAARTIRAGGVVTREGCALGVVQATGAVAELRWAEAEQGALVVGAAARDVALAGLQVAHAALRRRKPVIVLDPGGDDGIARSLGAACLATGTPLVTDGSPPAAGPAANVAGSSAAAGDAETAGASGLWGRGPGRERPPDDPAGIDLARTGRARTGLGRTSPAPTGPAPTDLAPVDLGRVVRQRSAALLTADSAERAVLACSELAALAADLRRIGVEGDALVWVPHAERVPAQALGELLGAGRDAGLAVLIGTTSPVSAAELAGLAGTVLIHRVADPGLAASLAARTGARLLPRPLATALAVQRPDAGMVPDAATATATAAADLVPSPVIPARTLLALGPAEFVLAANRPRPRLIESCLLVPARLPAVGAASRATRKATIHRQPAGRPGHREARA